MKLNFMRIVKFGITILCRYFDIFKKIFIQKLLFAYRYAFDYLQFKQSLSQRSSKLSFLSLI